MTAKPALKTFREAYTVLSGHAETLREQTEPNIDELLAIVTESVAAYKVCQARIDAVDQALKEALRDVDAGEAGARAGAGTASGTPAAGTGGRRGRSAPPAAAASDDDAADFNAEPFADDDDPPF